MKKSLLLIMLLCGITLGVFAQKTQETPVGVSVLDEQPQFKGGMPALQVFVSKNIKLPQEARNNHVNGEVVVHFIIEKDGTISNVSVGKGIGYGCDEEAVRVVKKMPKWIAGKKNKEAVRVKYMLPISFQTGE